MAGRRQGTGTPAVRALGAAVLTEGLDGTSRMSREAHVRICGGGQVRSLPATRQLAFGERVVVAHVGAGVRLGDAEVGEQERYGLGGHRGAAVGVDGQLPAADALFGAGAGDELLR